MSGHSWLPDKAISIRQPWVWAILNAGKDIENRSWPTRYRGDVCIHAAKACTKAEYRDFLVDANRLLFSHGISAALGVPSHLNWDSGGIVGIAEIIDCVEESDSPWFSGNYGFVLANVRPLPFIPVKGALGFFNWKSRGIVTLPGGER